jgi:hypothetical protein
MTAHTNGILPPAVCRTLALVCQRCPLDACLEDLKQTDGGSENGSNTLMVAWAGKWPMVRVRKEGRAAFVEQTNAWLHDTVLPEARRVVAGESDILDREQARTLIAILSH